MDSITDRVHRGAMLLDASVPGWASRINEAELDLGSCDRCVLGQVYGEYTTGRAALFGSYDDPYDYHVCRQAVRHGFYGWQYAALAAAWLVEIRARLVPAPSREEEALCRT